jgi:3-oxoacyl-[acyl-carrier protein] reductase
MHASNIQALRQTLGSSLRTSKCFLSRAREAASLGEPVRRTASAGGLRNPASRSILLRTHDGHPHVSAGIPGADHDPLRAVGSASKGRVRAMRNVVVTDGSGGVGLAIAKKLAESGYRAIAIARTSGSQLSDAIANAERSDQGRIVFVSFDLAHVLGLAELVRNLHEAFGPFHGLVNNPGAGTRGALSLMHTSKIEELVQLNTLSPIVLTKYIVRRMMADGGGRVVNVASIAACTGFSGLTVYGATKSSLIGFTRSLAREVGQMGINVNAIAPGFLDTDMTRENASDLRQAIVRRSALKRLPGADEVANAVEFLVSDRASGITGSVLTVDAGMTA